MTPQRHQGFLIIADGVTAKCESHDPDNSVRCDVEDLPCPLFSTSQSPWSRGGICRWFDNHCHLNISLLSSPALGFYCFLSGSFNTSMVLHHTVKLRFIIKIYVRLTLVLEYSCLYTYLIRVAWRVRFRDFQSCVRGHSNGT